MAKTVPINMRVEPVQQALLTMAAAALNKDRTAFILDVACQAAMTVLLDQRVFTLDEAQTKAFEEALEAPVPEHSKLSKLLTESAPWE